MWDFIKDRCRSAKFTDATMSARKQECAPDEQVVISSLFRMFAGGFQTVRNPDLQVVLKIGFEDMFPELCECHMCGSP